MDHRFCVAPMMDRTDRHCRYFHRLLTKRSLLYTEMLHSNAILNGDVKKNTQKMGEHIDFIERIYDNVKSPLGFLCNRINYLKGNSVTQYSLEYTNDKD